MTSMEARKFFDEEVLSRWPSWAVSETELGDWVRMLCRYDWDDSKHTIRQYAENKTRFETKTPSIVRFKGFMANRPNKKEKKPIEWPECTTFIQNIKTGKTFDVVLNPPNVEPDSLSRAAENMRAKLSEVYGGEWRVFKNTSRFEMWQLQSETREKTDAEIKKQLDGFCKPINEFIDAEA